MGLFKPSVDKMLAKHDVDGLIKMLADPEPKISDAARDSLLHIGEPALAALCAVIHDQQVKVRNQAIWVIGGIGDKTSGNAQAQAAQALLAALQDENSNVLRNAVVGLGKIRDPQSAKPLVALFASMTDDTDGEFWAQARIAITKIGIPAVDPLLAALKHQNVLARMGAAWALGDIGDRRAVEPLINSMKDENPVVRQNSASSLGQLCDPRAIHVLILGLNDQAVPVRQNAARSLGQLGNEQNAEPLSIAVEPLINSMEDEDPEVRQNSAVSLGQLCDPRAIRALTLALKDQVMPVRQGAARSLGQLAGEGNAGQLSIAIEPLIAILKDEGEEENTRRDATEALGKIRDPRATKALDDFREGVDSQGKSALMRAIDHGTIEEVRKIVQEGANVNHQDTYGKSPLMQVAFYGQLEIAQILIQHGADVNAKDHAGHTPLDWAADWGRPTIAQLLRGAGAKE